MRREHPFGTEGAALVERPESDFTLFDLFDLRDFIRRSVSGVSTPPSHTPKYAYSQVKMVTKILSPVNALTLLTFHHI
jgi:hypothetical protein